MGKRKFVAIMVALVLTSGLTVGLADPALGDAQPPATSFTRFVDVLGKAVERHQALVRQRVTEEQVAELVEYLAEVEDSTPLWPTTGALTSGFGMRWGAFHQGIDVAAPSGTPLMAVRAGVVVTAGFDGGYGNKVVVDHGDGMRSVYAHNRANVVAVGQSVVKGEVIAYVGSTGNSTGPHVHFEIHVHGVPHNPLRYLP